MLHTLNKRPDYEKNCVDNYQLAVPLIDAKKKYKLMKPQNTEKYQLKEKNLAGLHSRLSQQNLYFKIPITK